jgi:hypothetical protein
VRSGIPHADDNQLGGCGGHSESFHLASTRGASKRGASGSYISPNMFEFEVQWWLFVGGVWWIVCQCVVMGRVRHRIILS